MSTVGISISEEILQLCPLPRLTHWIQQAKDTECESQQQGLPEGMKRPSFVAGLALTLVLEHLIYRQIPKYNQTIDTHIELFQ